MAVAGSYRIGLTAVGIAALLMAHGTGGSAQQTAAPQATPPAAAQQPAPGAQPPAGPPPNPNTAATAADHQNMMEQLGIKTLRPGPSGNESAPNHANYDEALANPYPNLPEVLTLKNGKKVTSAETWWKQRRPEIVEEFDREVVGRVPKNVPKVTWRVNRTEQFEVGGRPVVGRELIGAVDNSALSRDHGRHPDDARHARPADPAGAGHDDVRRRSGMPPAPGAPPAPARGVGPGRSGGPGARLAPRRRRQILPRRSS